MKAMGTVSDATLNRYAKFERNLEKEKSNKKARLIRIAAIAACFAILIAAIPVSFMLRDGGGEPIIERDYFVMDGAAVKLLTSPKFKPTRIAGKVSDEFRNAAAKMPSLTPPRRVEKPWRTPSTPSKAGNSV